MAVYKIYPQKDTTLYSEYPHLNAGLDQILEVSNNPSEFTLSGVAEVRRALLAFNTTEILNVWNTYAISAPSTDVYLKLYTADATGLPESKTVYVNTAAQSWSMGTGKFGDTPQNLDGANWMYANYDGGTAWSTASNLGFTGSWLAGGTVGGGTWFTSSTYTFSQSVTYDVSDLSISVKPTVLAWISGTIANNGFIVRQANEFNNSGSYDTDFKFFSVDTHTIYPPELEFRWRDYTYNTSLAQVTANQPYISIQDNPGTFRQESIAQFRVNARPKYPARVFQTSSFYVTNYVLPTSSYYAVKDAYTDEYVIDFDTTYTQVSADTDGSYFTVYMNGLQPERYYKIVIKTIFSPSNVVLFEDQQYFKVIV